LQVILTLREKDFNFTIQAVKALPFAQLSMIRQLASTYEKSLARQLMNDPEAN
jgi:hypothetical protein